MVTVFGLATTRNVFHIGEEALMYTVLGNMDSACLFVFVDDV